MVQALLASALVGVGVGGFHYAAHVLAGDERDFEDAGVGAAGIAATVAAAVGTYIVLIFAGAA